MQAINSNHMRREILFINVCSSILDNAGNGKFVSSVRKPSYGLKEIDNLLYEYLGMSEEEIIKNLGNDIDITT